MLTVNLTLLGGIMRGRAFDDRAVQSIDVHVSSSVGTRDRDSTHVYRASRSITRQAPPRHAKFSGTTRRKQWTPGCTAATSAAKITSVSLANALRLDIRGVPEPCLWPAQHTVHTYITAHLVVTSEFDDSLVSLYLTHVPISQYSILDGALRGHEPVSQRVLRSVQTNASFCLSILPPPPYNKTF
ncbi:hypothetical protein BD769DRAFT_334168 [Suillus cothurnatus]|nr:hypothetical protein BD769DRAFT_334168 [Suillus cothurnatus]